MVAGFLPRLAGTVVTMTNSFFCIVEIIFVLFGDFATVILTDRMSDSEHVSCYRCVTFTPCEIVPVWTAGLLAWLSVVGSKCEQQSRATACAVK
ncbi:hypothetical protein FDP61_23260 [Enterobacter ludwigii]|nr:hypothetical protein [Enterobacter ludwigii]